MPRDVEDLRRIIKDCCEEAAAAGKVAMRAARTGDKVLQAIENLRGRVATVEALLRQFVRSASGVRRR
jgi:hypothetical protein